VTGIAVHVFWSKLYCHSYVLRWPADFATRCAVPGTGVTAKLTLFRAVSFFTAIPALWMIDSAGLGLARVTLRAHGPTYRDVDGSP
jgi:hypothetical protein